MVGPRGRKGGTHVAYIVMLIPQVRPLVRVCLPVHRSYPLVAARVLTSRQSRDTPDGREPPADFD